MIIVPEADWAVGMELYATDSPPCSARVKGSPEDFSVEEIVANTAMVAEAVPGYYPLYRVESRFIDTFHMAERLSRALGSRLSFGGLKDKRSVSTQFVTPTTLRSRRPVEIVDENFTARIVGYLPSPITRANVVGNKFEIVLRDCCSDVETRIEDTIRTAEANSLPNYYGLQRFGVGGVGTHKIGRAIVAGKFEEAALMLAAGGSRTGSLPSPLSEAMEKERYDEMARLLPPGRDVERRVLRVLERRKRDWIGALRAVPIRLRRLYVHAFQSYLFNRSLSTALKRGEDIAAYRLGDNWAPVSVDGLVVTRTFGVKDKPTGGVVPMMQIVGYAFRDYGTRFDLCISEVLQSEGVSPSSFYVKEMQEVSSEGGFRRPHLTLRSPAWNVDGGNAHMRFTLAKGQYATVLLREITKTESDAEFT